jgi:hypothetical protein
MDIVRLRLGDGWKTIVMAMMALVAESGEEMSSSADEAGGWDGEERDMVVGDDAVFGCGGAGGGDSGLRDIVVEETVGSVVGGAWWYLGGLEDSDCAAFEDEAWVASLEGAGWP